MSEKILADFKARYTEDSSLKREVEFTSCRIIVSKKRIVLVTNDAKKHISIKSIFDLRKSNLPDKIHHLVKNAVYIGYKDKNNKKVLLIDSGEEKLKKFLNILYKIILSGKKLYIKHPVKKGGLIVDSEWRSTKIKIKKGKISFGKSKIDIAKIQNVKVTKNKINKERKEILSIKYFKQGKSITTYFYIDNKRIFNILGRYIRKEYLKLTKNIQEIKLSNGEKETIVALYSGISEEQLPNILKKEVSDIKSIIYTLSEKDLIKRNNGELKLTKKGNIIANKNIEEVNI